MNKLILAAMLSLAAAASVGASATPAAPGASPVFKEAEARLMTKRAAVIVDAMGKEEMMMRIHSADPDKVKGTLAVTMRDLYTGITYINAGTTGAEIQLPFGGTKGTGNGHRDAGTAALEVYTEWKVLYVDFSGKIQKAQIDEYEG